MTNRNFIVVKLFMVFIMIFGLIGMSIQSPLTARAIETDLKDEALEKGAAWIVARQLDSGGWTENRDPGTTSLAISALTAYAKHLGLNPLDPEYVYSVNVNAALNYVFSKTQRDAGNGFVHWGTGQIYVLGPALMAITSVETPDQVIDLEGSAVDGMTHLEVVEEIVNFIAEAQVKTGPGIGLWYYNHPTTTGDMSIAGWVTLGLSYAKEKFDVDLPQTMLDYLDEGIDIVLWDDDPDHELYGGTGYTSSSTIEDSYRYWINIHKTGHLLSMLQLVGDPIDSVRVQAVIGFIERHFYAPNSGAGGTSSEWPYSVNDYIDVGWRGKDGVTNPSYNGALTIMKGLLAYGIDTIFPDEVETDWQDVFEDVIVANQHPDGYWQSGGYPSSTSETYRLYYTSWAMMTLLRSVPSIAVTGVDLTCPETSLIAGDDSILLKPTLVPADASNPNVTWNSSDPTVASIVNGLLTPLKAGTTTVTVTTEDGNYSKQCTITVKAPFEFVTEIVEDKSVIGVEASNLRKATLFTVAELNEGSSVKLIIEVLSLENVNSNDRALVEAYANANIEGDQRRYYYLDISLFKIVGELETKLTSSLEGITIVFVVPEALRGKDFKPLRVHNGVVETFEYVYDDDTFEVTLYTNKFSTYVLAYGVDILPDASDSTHAGGWLMLLGLVLMLFSREKKAKIK